MISITTLPCAEADSRWRTLVGFQKCVMSRNGPSFLCFSSLSETIQTLIFLLKDTAKSKPGQA